MKFGVILSKWSKPNKLTKFLIYVKLRVTRTKIIIIH